MPEPAPERLAQLSRALDEAVAREPAPDAGAIEQEIADMRAESPDLGEDPADTEYTLRQMSGAFWHDWFAVDTLVEPLAMTEEEVWGICLAREAARKPRLGPQA